MARARTMLLIRKARKLIAKHASERQYAHTSVHAPPPPTHWLSRNTDISLVDPVLRDLCRTRRAHTIRDQADRKLRLCKRSRQLRFPTYVLFGLLI